MPRDARTKSATGIYHCIVRGIDKQDIFLDDFDRKKFIKELIRTKEKYSYELFAYCLMDNHIHLMIKDNTNEINKIMQSLMISYSEFFNKKYERTGHLFQNRYLSKPVESERYALTLQRYIHQNPHNMKHYKWSSFKEYINNNGITDTEFILNLFAENREEAITEFIKYNSKIDKQEDAKLYKELEIIKYIPDKEVIEIIKKAFNIDNILEIKKYNTTIRKQCIESILDFKITNIKQISRILQLDKKTVQRISKERCVPKGDKCPPRETSPKDPKEVQDGKSDDSVCL